MAPCKVARNQLIWACHRRVPIWPCTVKLWVKDPPDLTGHCVMYAVPSAQQERNCRTPCLQKRARYYYFLFLTSWIFCIFLPSVDTLTWSTACFHIKTDKFNFGYLHQLKFLHAAKGWSLRSNQTQSYTKPLSDWLHLNQFVNQDQPGWCSRNEVHFLMPGLSSSLELRNNCQIQHNFLRIFLLFQ